MTMNRFQVDQSSSAAQVEQIFAQAAIAGSASLLATHVGEAVLDGDAFAPALPTLGGCHELAQPMLQTFISGNGDGAVAPGAAIVPSDRIEQRAQMTGPNSTTLPGSKRST
jgi:hypothetical protein